MGTEKQIGQKQEESQHLRVARRAQANIV